VSVRQGIVALLAEQPMHAYQLKQEFERRTGGTWPLNIGQVWTTLQRLVRDGLVEPAPASGAEVEQFRLTGAGRAEAEAWWARPVERGAPARDELAIKVALAVTAPGVDVARVIQAQRTETLRSLRDYTRLVATAGAGPSTAGASADQRADIAWTLVLDSLVFAAEAEVRWLDHVEARLARLGPETPRHRPAPDGGPVDVPSTPATTATEVGR
jgi:DNA-binding PadR family transcriptional regulator